MQLVVRITVWLNGFLLRGLKVQTMVEGERGCEGFWGRGIREDACAACSLIGSLVALARGCMIL